MCIKDAVNVLKREKRWVCFLGSVTQSWARSLTVYLNLKEVVRIEYYSL